MAESIEEHIFQPHFMWVWKSGTRCQVCDQRATCIHKRDGKNVGYFCREHFPVGLPVISSGPHCRVCGKLAVILDDEGWACEDHRRGTLDGGVSSAPLDGAGDSIPSPG